MDIISQHILAVRNERPNKYGVHTYYPVEPIVLGSGLILSVQASESHYCEPRNNEGPWISFEVGYPSQIVPELEPYWDQSNEDRTKCCYGWVPLEVLMDIIAQHGNPAVKVISNEGNG